MRVSKTLFLTTQNGGVAFGCPIALYVTQCTRSVITPGLYYSHEHRRMDDITMFIYLLNLLSIDDITMFIC